jgi:hypothetical protein
MRDSLFYQTVSRHLNLVHTFDVFPNLHGLPTPANTYVNLQNVLNKCLKNVLSNYLKKDRPPLPGVCYLKTPRDIRLGNADIVWYGDCKTNKYTCLSVCL